MAGENPEGCWARGINPTLVRTLAAIAGGMLVGLGGAAFSLSVKPGWGQPQGCERIGWIALALVIFGSWHPLRVVAGAYFLACCNCSVSTSRTLSRPSRRRSFRSHPSH